MYIQIKVTIYADDNNIRSYLLKQNFTCCYGNGKLNKNKLYHVHDRDAIKSSRATTFIQYRYIDDSNDVTQFVYGAQLKSDLNRIYGSTRTSVVCSPYHTNE